MGYLLAASETELTRDTFDVLLDITSGALSTPIPLRSFHHLPGLAVALDLIRLHTCDMNTRRYVMDCLAQITTSSNLLGNVLAWRDAQSAGVFALIELLHLHPNGAVFSSVIQILEGLSASFSAC